MKLYRIPWPWDYHGQSAFIVAATDPDSAVLIAKAHFAKTHPESEENDSWDSYRGKPRYNEIQEIPGYVYVDSGCDC